MCTNVSPNVLVLRLSKTCLIPPPIFGTRSKKRKYIAMMNRVAALPEDYRFVFQKIQDYMW